MPEAKCNAPVTGQHRDRETISRCPRCGPRLRQMDSIDKRHKRLGSPAKPSRWPEQHNRQRRGHDFYPPETVTVPALGDTDGVDFPEKMLVMHYFVGGSDWWIAEADEDTGEAFGYACLNGDAEMAEWGYISLVELERIRVGALSAVIERDVAWRPRKASEAELPSSR
jgi:hypothetical protein